MTIVSVEYNSLDFAESFVPEKETIVISIRSPGSTPAKLHPDITQVLRLFFEDSVPKLQKQNMFSPAHAKEVISFLHTHHADSTKYHLLVHCEAGISRSAAVAVFAASECDLSISGKLAFLNPHVLTTLVKETCPMYAFD